MRGSGVRNLLLLRLLRGEAVGLLLHAVGLLRRRHVVPLLRGHAVGLLRGHAVGLLLLRRRHAEAWLRHSKRQLLLLPLLLL